MKITAIGAGSAFAPISIGHSNFLIEHNKKKMIIDCGTHTPFILRDEMNIPLQLINSLIVTHVHADHTGGCEMLGFYRYFVPDSNGNKVKPILFAASSLIQPLWDHCLKGGMDCVVNKTMGLSDYFEINSIAKSKSFTWENIKFDLVQTTHVPQRNAIKPAYGVFIENPETGKKLFISGDTVFNPDVYMFYYEQADLIFHDVETTDARSRVHPNWRDLQTLPEGVKQKMWLYHYSKEIEMPGFAGFIQKGQSFNI